jgi:hypothetical protein
MGVKGEFVRLEIFKVCFFAAEIIQVVVEGAGWTAGVWALRQGSLDSRLERKSSQLTPQLKGWQKAWAWRLLVSS